MYNQVKIKLVTYFAPKITDDRSNFLQLFGNLTCFVVLRHSTECDMCNYRNEGTDDVTVEVLVSNQLQQSTQ